MINTQLDTGFESSSGFRDAFSKIMGAAPKKLDQQYDILKARWIHTPLGAMLAISDEKALHLLEFVDRHGLERKIERLRKKLNAAIIPQETDINKQIKSELELYFKGKLKIFKTPLQITGTDFQEKSWEALSKIPYGETRSYAEQAKAIGQKTAFRAVARANGTNQIAIVIPCHRIINSNGELGGYGGGIHRKKWLIEHEKKYP